MGEGRRRTLPREKKRAWMLGPALRDEGLRLLPGYQECIDILGSDAVVAPHLNRLVGTSTSAHRIEPNDVLRALICATLDHEGNPSFAADRFQKGCEKLVGLFGVDRIAFKTVAPLPNLTVPEFPLRLNDEIVLDRLTEDEVTRCCQVGVLRPSLSTVLFGDTAVGIRRTRFVPKLIWHGDESPQPPTPEGEGAFGNRPQFRDDLVIGDVLSTLRLFLSTQLRAAGVVNWTDAPWLNAGTSFRQLGQWPYGGRLELSEADVTAVLALWRLLEGGAKRFAFGIHRFNLAFDRGLLADRIVDLVIAGETLFLSDLGKDNRGELKYRFALRAAKFIEHPHYGERDIFKIMGGAYDARSAIVHGGSPKETKLPNDRSATLSTFTHAVEECLRLAFHKALLMKEDGAKLRKPEYWDDLVFKIPSA